jgi:hypothetical protein
MLLSSRAYPPDTRVSRNLQPTRLNANATISSRLEWHVSAYVLDKIMKIKIGLSLWSEMPNYKIAAFKSNNNQCHWKTKALYMAWKNNSCLFR